MSWYALPWSQNLLFPHLFFKPLKACSDMLHCLLAYALKTVSRETDFSEDPYLTRFWKAYPSVHCSVKEAPCLTVVKCPKRRRSCMLFSLHACFSCVLWTSNTAHLSHLTHIRVRNQTVWNQVSQQLSLVMCVQFTCMQFADRSTDFSDFKTCIHSNAGKSRFWPFQWGVSCSCWCICLSVPCTFQVVSVVHLFVSWDHSLPDVMGKKKKSFQ